MMKITTGLDFSVAEARLRIDNPLTRPVAERAKIEASAVTAAVADEMRVACQWTSELLAEALHMTDSR